MELDIESLIGGFEELVKPKHEEKKTSAQSQDFNDKCIDCGSFLRRSSSNNLIYIK